MDQNTPKKEETNTGYNLRERDPDKKYTCKASESTDTSDSEYVPKSSDGSVSSDNEDAIDMKEYKKFLYSMFPSKHLKAQIEAAETTEEEEDSSSSETDEEPPTKTSNGGAALDNSTSNNDDDKPTNIKRKKRIRPTLVSKTEDDNTSETSKSATKTTKKRKKSKKSASVAESKSCDTDGSSSSEDSDDSSSSDDEDTDKWLDALFGPKGKKSNADGFNIIFTVGDGKLGLGKDDDSDDSDDSEGSTSSSSSNSSDEYVAKHTITTGKNSMRTIRKTSSSKKQKSPKNKTSTNKTSSKKEKSLTEEEINRFDTLKELLSPRPDDKVDEVKANIISKFEKIVDEERERLDKQRQREEKKQKTKNAREFRKLLNQDNEPSEISYFKKLDVEKQNTIISEIKKINEHTTVKVPYRMQLIERDIPIHYKAAAMRKINVLEYMDPGSGEYYKIKKWVDTFMTIPFGTYSSLPLTISDGPDKCSEFMMNAKKILDDCVYGLDDAKMQILQVVGQWISNPSSMGTAIAIKGPMGTGKTTLVKEGISKILQRPFSFVALGGATDSAFLEGHSYTYEGSKWGHIVDILRTSKCMNPVIYFDELDKVSDTPKGEEITGILTHLTDTTQNTQYHDKYFSGVDFNLSKCLFIFSYNDERKVNPILRDRMYCITTKGYDVKEKVVIAKNHLIPKIEENVGFEPGQIVFDDDTLTHIASTHTKKEKGVRNMKRCLEIIYTKLNLHRLMKPGDKLYGEDEDAIEVKFPFNVTTEVVDKLIKKAESDYDKFKYFYT